MIGCKWIVATFALLVVISLASAYVPYRNVRNYGAYGDGIHDDTQAIITALTQDRADNPSDQYPDATYSSSTKTPAFVYFPAGTYLVTQTLPVVYYTQMVGEYGNTPTILFVSNAAVRIIEVEGSWFPQSNTENFYRQIRNFIIDMTRCNQCTGIHWQVAQATSITNVYFKMNKGSGAQGMWMENGSGGFFSDVVFEGGLYGMWVGNQQFTTRNVTIRDTSVAAIYLNWDWAWTFVGMNIINSPVGIDNNSGTGSLTVIDSAFQNCGIAIRTRYNPSSTTSINSLVLENIDIYNNAPNQIVLQNNGVAAIVNNGLQMKVQGYVQGYVWQNGQSNLQQLNLSSIIPRRPVILLDPSGSGRYYQNPYPQYPLNAMVNVSSTFGIIGDGQTDVTVALQNALTTSAGRFKLYFPSGKYIISNTIYIPPGSVIIGEAWSTLVATGNNFQNANNPIPFLQAGKVGDTGELRLINLMISNQGILPGAKMIEWNIRDSPGTIGTTGMWDVHFRMGGAIGTNINPSDCPAGDGSSARASQCTGAAMLMHVTTRASIYMENVWGWVADHDIDRLSEINVYNSRGFFCESNGPVWMYGTAMEHSVLYQYNFRNARNVFVGMAQTETPYYQPSQNTPFNPNPAFGDPSYCNNDPRCNMAWALAFQNSSNIFWYGTGFYSFFNVWGQNCLKDPQGPSCQINLINVNSNSNKNIYMYATNTYGSVYMLSTNEGYSQASSNPNTFCSTGIVNLNLWN